MKKAKGRVWELRTFYLVLCPLNFVLRTLSFGLYPLRLGL